MKASGILTKVCSKTYNADHKGADYRKPFHQYQKDIYAVGALEVFSEYCHAEMPNTQKATNPASNDHKCAVDSCAHVVWHWDHSGQVG
jgi:hypothetical protein